MRRRQFLVGAAGSAAAVAGLPGVSWGRTGRASMPAKLDRIAIMTLNFESILRVPDVQPNPARTVEVMDIAEMLADTYGVHRIEFQHYHIPDTEPSYLRALRDRFARSHSRVTQINLEFGDLNLSAPSNRLRLMATDLTKRWVDLAVLLGAQRVMANQGPLTEANLARGTPVYKKMVDYGKANGIIVSLETRGNAPGQEAREAAHAEAVTRAAASGSPPPPPLQPAWAMLHDLIEAAGGYSNVDMGGARAANQEELHAVMRRMMPVSAGSIHTRLNPNWDLATVIRYLEGELGYRGLYTIEVGSAHEGTKAIYDVVMATLG